MKHVALILSFLIFCGPALAQGTGSAEKANPDATMNETPSADKDPMRAALDPSGALAFFGVTYLDTSLQGELQGERPEERARIEMLEDLVRERFSEEGFTLLDLAPVSEELDRTVNPADCYGCELRMGKTLDARYVVVGEVQKVSNLILSMNLVMRDVETGRMVRGQSVDIRSNTDDSWLRGMRYILNNNIFKT